MQMSKTEIGRNRKYEQTHNEQRNWISKAPGCLSGWASSLAQVMIPGSWGITSHIRLPVHVACFSLCLCLCLSLCDYHKKKLKVKNRATLRFQNCTVRYLPRGYKSNLVDSKGNTQPSVGSSIINNSKTVYTAQMSIDRWMGRDNVVNIHTATSLGHQKGWNEAIYNDVGEVERTYAQGTQSVRERYQIPYNCIHMWIFKKPNKLAKGRRRGWEMQTKKHTLNHRE